MELLLSLHVQAPEDGTAPISALDPFSSPSRRWSRNARLDYYDNEAIAIEENRPCTTLVERRSDLLYCISQLVDEGCMSTKAYQHARKGILQLKKECRHMNEYREPEHANTKGGEKRLKSSKEKAKRKERLCRRCN
eukprot:TRINITY_DN7536_c0_g1_i7.p1 TRINITY_DN7536_c0_g1~~TRINITY_DN7536_c0_g1_i7.p1  ORF type:complete len:136 (+),score=19.46 TRINITY_DN7536_c0_g1_i7:240-647(+)